MAHNLYKKNGIYSAAYSVGKNGLPWHHLGQFVENAMTWEKAYKLAHLNWEVKKQELYIKNPAYTPGSTECKGYKVPGQFAITRSDVAGPKGILGIVGSTYEPTQNLEIGGWIDNVLENIDDAHYESAGVLGKGQRVWALAKVPFNATVGNDIHETYLLFLSSHDGSMSNTIMLTDVRVVCENTLNFALSSSTKNAMIKVRHTKGAKEKLGKITEEIQTGLKQDVESLKVKFEKLINKRITKETFTQTMTKIFGEKWENSESKSTKALEIAKLFNDNDNNAIPEQANTGMALLNAVTNYVDHHRPSRVTANSGYSNQNQSRSDSAWLGTGSQLKSNTLETILEVVEEKPTVKNPNPGVQVNKSVVIDNILNLVN